ncbi:hypothetical protein NMS18_003583 [Vibrio cholerae]|nr:hypothetical protein [Vibrio cholerae]EJL6445815.1 hypothetical protein [Vibrio cholerae]NOF13951.1 hypothetical protein [Vibrio cholerae]NOF18852.1 hypothetical protein [Vibrio cholerae]
MALGVCLRDAFA